MTGNEEYLKLMLNQQDPRRSARMVSYYRYFSAARAARIAAFNRTLAELALVAEGIAASSATPLPAARSKPCSVCGMIKGTSPYSTSVG